jgi:hypothetical protein
MMNPQGRKNLLPLAAGYVPIVALLCIGWPLLTSSMGLRPIEVSSTESEFLASWIDKVQRTFVLPNLNLLLVRSYAAWKVLIWAAPALLTVALITKPKNPIHRILLVAILISFTFYLFFPYDQGHGWGYRYLHPAWGLIPVVAGIFATQVDSAAPRQFTSALLCAGILASPVFMITTHRTIATSVAQDIRLTDSGRAFVFIANHPSLYTVDLIRNYPSDAGRTIRMLSQGEDADNKFVALVAPTAVKVISDQRGSAWIEPAARNSPKAHAPGTP